MLSVIKSFLGLIVLVLFFSCTSEKSANKIPLEVFFKNPDKTDFKISPNGKFISYLQPYKSRLNVYVQSLEMGYVKQITFDSVDHISRYFWLNNDELLYMKELSAGEGEQMFVVDKEGSNKKDLLQGQKGKIQLINGNRLLNNELLVALLNKQDSTVFDAYRLNVKTQKLTLAYANPGNIIRWFADERGKLRLALSSDGVNESLLYRKSEDQPLKTVITYNFKTAISPIGFCKHDDACIYALSNIGRDKKAVVEFNCATRKEYKKIFSHPLVDVTEASYSPDKRQLLSYSFETWKREEHYLDSSLKIIYSDLQKRLEATQVKIVDKDLLEEKLIVRSYTDKTPGAFYLYHPSSKKLTKLSDVNPDIMASQMCEMKPVSYQSRDGLTIRGYITFPKGKSPVNLPVVVIPHGGPTTRDSWGFDEEVQFLANRGYAVFQPNFRGSSGYGKKFWIAGFKQWGNSVQNDITDGVKWLIERKIADKKRIAIYGSNFGGFSALYGLCFHPDLYACGVSYSGLINLFTYIKDVPSYYKPIMQMYYERVGNPEKDADYFRTVSPVFNISKIKDPVLIAQGAKDPRANINEVNEFVRKLKNRNVPITYILKENEGYYFKSQENRIEFYSELEKFLSENL
jgi:dipeptidyl aminopeptidase/acylaminoacyl peptidase